MALLDARCGLPRSGFCDSVIVIGQYALERIPAVVPRNLFFVLRGERPPGY